SGGSEVPMYATHALIGLHGCENRCAVRPTIAPSHHPSLSQEVEVVRGAVSAADRQRCANRLSDILLRTSYRLGQGPFEREVCGDGRRVRASGTMGVGRVDARSGEGLEVGAVVEDVYRLRPALQM